MNGQPLPIDHGFPLRAVVRASIPALSFAFTPSFVAHHKFYFHFYAAKRFIPALGTGRGWCPQREVAAQNLNVVRREQQVCPEALYRKQDTSHTRRSPWQQSDYKLYRINHTLQLQLNTSVNQFCSYPQTVRTLAAAKGSMSLPIQSTPVRLPSYFSNQFSVLSVRRSSARLCHRLPTPASPPVACWM